MTNNERIAVEIMGWRLRGDGRCSVPGKFGKGLKPNFEHSLSDCFLMEEKIKEKGWADKYAMYLEQVLELEAACSCEGMFALAHATPQQRVAAAIRMLDERGGGK